jgi:excisionase family DNA binding protein
MHKTIASDAAAPAFAVALGIEDAARAAGISRTQLYQEMRTGRLASKKIGKRRVVPVDALKAWIAAAPAA